MPTYRVAETIPARPHAFDVVIVDEASQSGVDALRLALLRLRASEFYRDPEAALELLWKQLQERGTWPVRA